MHGLFILFIQMPQRCRRSVLCVFVDTTADRRATTNKKGKEEKQWHERRTNYHELFWTVNGVVWVKWRGEDSCLASRYSLSGFAYKKRLLYFGLVFPVAPLLRFVARLQSDRRREWHVQSLSTSQNSRTRGGGEKGNWRRQVSTGEGNRWDKTSRQPLTVTTFLHVTGPNTTGSTSTSALTFGGPFSSSSSSSSLSFA